MSDFETACPDCRPNSDAVTGGSGLFTKHFDVAEAVHNAVTCRGTGTVLTEKGSDLARRALRTQALAGIGNQGTARVFTQN